MGTTLTHSGRASLIFLGVTLITFASFSCQPSPPSNANQNARVETAAPSPAQIVIPPWPTGFPSNMPLAAVSGNIPQQVLLPGLGLPGTFSTPLEIRPYFDYFSWESFIALNWPAATGARGVPNQPNNSSVFLNAAAGTPVVWGTYKDSFDLFGQKDQRPSPWESNTSPISPCANGQPGAKTLIFVSKGNTPLMETKQAFSFPLVDQQGNYVYYDIRYDQAQYNFIRGQEGQPSTYLYLLKNLAPAENAQFGVQMPMTTAPSPAPTPSATPAPSPASTLGSIMVKAAWRIKTDKDDASRFYTTAAQTLDPQTQKCTPVTVLLVGLHIAHKIDPFTEWVWSTFEQVDNVPPDADIKPQPPVPPNGYSFNNGTTNPSTTGGYSYKPAVAATPSPSPVQVTRVNPIPSTPAGQSTREVNAFYQQLLKGTVWQYYQLVVTQWPFNPGIGQGNPYMLMENGGVYPQNAGSAFPVNGAVNTTMETYFQTQNDAAGAGGNSCMSCHYRAGQSDFSWGLNRRAH
ncbi:MAG: hypothetical protein H7Z16_16515 [Pyrinomonadaceae bacterium]|nr:hypothetical protein [Pyrinomonadaceae bacterium]